MGMLCMKQVLASNFMGNIKDCSDKYKYTRTQPLPFVGPIFINVTFDGLMLVMVNVTASPISNSSTAISIRLGSRSRTPGAN